VENESANALEEIPGLLKMAGTTLIGLAIPLGAVVAVREIKLYGGLWAIVVCFSIVLAMSMLGFMLILVSGKIMKLNDRMSDDSER
jgi:hypothetical protein